MSGNDGQSPIAGADAGASFTVAIPDALPIPILIAVPHAGRHYGPAILEALRDPIAAAMRLEDRYADRIGEAAAAQSGAALIVAKTARAVIDLNRAPEDVDWGMVEGAGLRKAAHSAGNVRSRHGLGLVPRRVHGMGELWKRRLTASELDARLAQVHRPYHQAIGETLEKIRDRWGHALLLDLHSMPPLVQPGGEGERVELVVGDRFGAACAGELSQAALRYFERNGRVAAHNRPYSGGYALDRHATPRRGVHALQLEICRTSYLDARLDHPGPRLPAIARLVAGLVRTLAGELENLAPATRWRNAAQ